METILKSIAVPSSGGKALQVLPGESIIVNASSTILDLNMPTQQETRSHQPNMRCQQSWATRRSRSGNNEGLLSFCADDTEWTFVGDKTLKGKEAVRQYMAATYIEPPVFTVANLIAEGDFVTALGDITLKDEDGKAVDYSYCDVWRFRGDINHRIKGFRHQNLGQQTIRKYERIDNCDYLR